MRVRIALAACSLFFPDQAYCEADDRHDSEQEEKNFRNFHSSCGDAAEAKNGCNQSDYQEND